MAGGPTKRLSKVAREFNQSISTIIDYLSSNGHDIEANPNTKVPSEMYDLLLNEYQADKAVREESKLVGADRTKKETISLESIDPNAGNDKRNNEEQDEIIIKNIENVASAPEVQEEAPVKEENTQVEPTPEAKEDTSEPTATETKGEEYNKVSIEETTAEGSGDINIVGKIDLDQFKKKKPKVEKPKEEPKKQAPKKQPGIRPKVAEIKEQPKKEKEQPKEPELIKATIKKLDGPKVINKIELPPERKKTPRSSDGEKKKRKRIIKSGPNKVDLAKESRSFHQNKRKPGGGTGRPVVKKAPLTEEQIQKEVRETLARLSSKGKSKGSKYRKAKRDAASVQAEEQALQEEVEKKILQVTEFVTANQLSGMMDVPVNDIISACMSLGLFVSINQRLDAETIVAEEFGYSVEFTSADVQESIETEEDKPEDLVERSPIITVMGHVDHGKTSLLDYVRKSNVIAGEAGGITQHIGAYSVAVNDKKITFLDTPGHEAFTAMRARGAQVTDVAVIVIAADDSVMPQTKEAINHAQAAGVPMVFAINKIDKDGANPDRVREQLSTMDILVEDWGGKFQCQEISAKKGMNMDLLLEKILLEAELLELKANPKRSGSGTIIESSLDKGRGYVSNILVQNGTLRIGDVLLAGSYSGKVKAMFNELGASVKEAGPASPVSILGLDGAPSAGDRFNVLADEKEAKNIATKRQQLIREQGIRAQKHITLDEIGRRIAIGDFQELNIIVKGDVDGSIEALSDSLLKLTTEKIQVNIIHKSVGQISESDVLLASASDAIIVGFQVRPSSATRKLAEKEQIDIRLYSIIYKAIEEIKSAMEGMLAPTIEETIVCNIEVRETFKITKVGTIAGCFVTDGKVTRNTKIRLIRDGIVIHTGELGSLKRFKDDVKEVKKGYECGLNIHKYNDIKVGDVIEGYEEVEVQTKL